MVPSAHVGSSTIEKGRAYEVVKRVCTATAICSKRAMVDLPRCGWMDERVPASPAWDKLEPHRLAEQQKLEQKRLLLQQGNLIDEVNNVEEEVSQ